MLIRLISLFALLIVTACGPSSSHSSREALDWPTLKSLDHQVHELEGILEMEEKSDLLTQQVGRVLSTLSTLLAEGIPANVARPELVQQKMKELQALSLEIQRSVDDPEEAPLAALHPLVADLMEVAGMPHVHDEHDHDHHDHDHGDHVHDHGHDHDH